MQYKGRKAFTIIELVIVIAIIAILATLAIISFRNYTANARLTKATEHLQLISTAITQYAEDNSYQYPGDVSRSVVPTGVEKYLAGGVWPTGPWPRGAYDYDNWLDSDTGKRIYQVTYRLCGALDDDVVCNDPVLFPNFERNSGIYYCISGACVPHQSTPEVPGYCVNCKPKEVNY